MGLSIINIKSIGTLRSIDICYSQWNAIRKSDNATLTTEYIVFTIFICIN